MKSKRLEILENSLKKKERLFDAKMSEHFDSVRQANGQPLNDKRNGHATFNRWERQNGALRRLKSEIQKTKDAIEREEDLCAGVELAKEILPDAILGMIESGVLVQWRKHPNIFFVKGVDKARIGWEPKKKFVYNKHYSEINDADQRATFREVFNSLHSQLNPKEH